MKQTVGSKRTGYFESKTPKNRHAQGKMASSLAPPDYGIGFVERNMADSRHLKRNSGSWIQPKLILGQVGDPYEQEADRLANKVVGRMASSSQQTRRTQKVCRGQAGKTVPLNRMIEEEDNRKDLMRSCRKQNQKKPLMGRGSESGNLSPWVSGRIKQSQGCGSPLPSAIQHTTESKLGYDFDEVRVKTGTDAADVTQKLGAKAFTHGSDIWLGPEANINDTRLMAHELVHVVQQGSAPALSGTGISSSKSLKRLMPPLARPDITLKDHHDSVRMIPASYPSMDTLAADKTVEAARAEDWTAGEADHKERSGWIMWNEKSGDCEVINRKIGTWEGVNPGPTPGDTAPRYCVGHYHQHPSLPDGTDSNHFPVGPSGADENFANSRKNPGIVRDFKTKARKTVTNYKYGPNVRA